MSSVRPERDIVAIHDAGFRVRVVASSSAHRALWDSPSHRANMLSDAYGHIGVGVVRKDGAVWAVELFSD